MPSLFSATDQELALDTSQPQSQPTTLGSNGAEDGEEDWSQLGVNNAMNLWCGASISEASDNCGRKGYNCPEGICPTNYLKCFMVDDSCNYEKKDTNLPTPRPVAPSGGISTTPPLSSGHTPKPSAAADESEVKAQNYCAKQKADLKAGCFTAQTCNDDDPPCPVGTYCWGNIVCTEPKATPQPSPRPSKQPSESPIAVVNGVCATNYPELQKTCWNGAKCSNINLCSDGQKCSENIDCNFVSPKVPSQSTNNPTPQPTSSSSGDETNKPVELYCAFNESELGKPCSDARSCVDEPCPLGMLCIPFNCEQKEDVSTTTTTNTASSEAGTYIVQSDNNDSTSPINDNYHELCPDFFVGWHTRADCKEYFACSNGQIGPLYTCGEGLKFDKVRGKCHAESEVNQYCYGISNTEAYTPAKSRCTLGYTGWDAKPGCSQYYWCNNGHEEAFHDCGENLLFDLELELCNFAYDVDCPYDFDMPTSSPTISKRVTPSPLPSPKVVSESDGLAEFDVWPSTISPTSTKNFAIPPWLNDIRVTSNGVASTVPSVHRASWMMSLLSALYLLAYFC